MMVAVVLGSIAIAVAVWALLRLLDPPVRLDHQRSAADVIARVTGECHPEPPTLTAELAHTVLQDRIECSIERCGAKWAAYWFLVDQGHIVPGRQVAR
ncbi:hypothetical protein [Nocardia farcinica]|uniref:hypothetical protein n=1 Tax=Nocardia farcinica TaxID=37329 RepID=UPI0018953B59|nr:hypothetical protein [Nocardia farcinica]MBF6411179.1 hypothetical protein [Nocardia farcinica]